MGRRTPIAQAGERRDVVKTALVDEDRPVRGRERITSFVGGGVQAIDGKEAGHRLLLEPLADVALGGAGLTGQLTRSHPPPVALGGKGPVEARP